MTTITTATSTLGTRFGGRVDLPFKITHIENNLQMALGQVRGTAVIDTGYTVQIDDKNQWDYRFVVDGTNHRVFLDQLELVNDATAGTFTDRERIDAEPVEQGIFVEAYERALAQLCRRAKETDSGGLTTTHGDGILSAVYRRYADDSDEEIARTEAVPFASYTDIEDHFVQDATRHLWRSLTAIEQIR